jgi:hypothetical protein
MIFFSISAGLAAVTDLTSALATGSVNIIICYGVIGGSNFCVMLSSSAFSTGGGRLTSITSDSLYHGRFAGSVFACRKWPSIWQTE